MTRSLGSFHSCVTRSATSGDATAGAVYPLRSDVDRVAKAPRMQSRSPLYVSLFTTETDLEMFVYYFMYIDRPFLEARRLVLNIIDGLPEAAGIAYREGEQMQMRAGVAPGLLSKAVRVRVGDPVDVGAETAIPVSWKATGPTRLFPVMEGELVIAGIGSAETQLIFRGSYHPPFGGLGKAIDKILLHRIAEATAKYFVDRIGAAVIAQPDTTRKLAVGS